MIITTDEDRICIGDDCIRYRIGFETKDIPSMPALLRDWLACVRRLQPAEDCYLPFAISSPGYDLSVVHCFEASRVGNQLHLRCTDVQLQEPPFGFPGDIITFAFNQHPIFRKYSQEFGCYSFDAFLAALQATTNDRNG
jgi:hypothetical protein